MTSTSDQEFAHTEAMLRQRLTQLADHAPTTVHMPDEIAVVTSNRPARRGRRAGVIAAVAALIGAGGFTTYSFLGASNDGGAATPEEAVTTFVSAVEHEDVLGMIDVTLPEEVGALRGMLDSFTTDAKRAQVLGDDFNAGGVRGVDVSVTDLKLDTQFLEGGLAIVQATGGTVSASFDPQAFPFGDKLRALLDDNLHAGTASTTLTTGDPLALLMTVQRDGRWYISLEYTGAEYIRRAAGWEIPGAVSRTPAGFDSPEQAVTGFYQRLASLDVQSALDTFAPGEDAMAWLAQSWLADAQAAIDRGRTDGWSVAVSGLTYDTIGEGDRRTLRPVTFKVEGTVPAGLGQDTSGIADPESPTIVSAFDGSGYALVPPGQVPSTISGLHFSTTFPSVGGPTNFTTADADGNITLLVFDVAAPGVPQPFTVERAGDCTTYTGGASTMFGVASTPGATHVDGGYQICGSGASLGALSLLVITGGTTDLPAISVVQSDGKWYVSPLGTVLASVSNSVHGLDATSSLFDSPLAPLLYGGLSRGTLDSHMKGRPAGSVDPACLPALTVDNGTVTGTAPDPPVDAVKACLTAVFDFDSSTSTSTSSGSGVADVTPIQVATTAPASAPPPASTP